MLNLACSGIVGEERSTRNVAGYSVGDVIFDAGVTNVTIVFLERSHIKSLCARGVENPIALPDAEATVCNNVNFREAPFAPSEIETL
jgi:hypothetical protein